jgi:hypothetical protein
MYPNPRSAGEDSATDDAATIGLIFVSNLRGMSPQANYTDRETAAC